MKPFQPRISVVIPVYNGANYLAAAIDSALAQTYDNVEVLVVDDGSTDDGATEAVARSYGDRIRYHRKENGGVSSALNRGIALMQGEYFAWLSHDDRYLPEKFTKQLEFIQGGAENIEALATGLEVIDSTGAVASKYSCESIRVLRTGKDVMDHWVYGCSLLIHKSVFDRAGGFNESNRTVQDLEMWLKMVHEGTAITMMPEVLCQWRHHGESDSYRKRAAHFAEVDAFLHRIATSYPLEFFRGGQGEITPRERLSLYRWFAQQAMNRGCTRRAYAFYKSALVSYPNLLDRAFWAVLRQYLASHRASAHVR
jgi:glycosyltransferase involved in cell wall biosynthesis